MTILDNSDHPMAALLEQHLNFDVPVNGDLRTGVVIARRGNDILVDIGAKSEGVIAASEYESLTDEMKERLGEGAEVEVFVVNTEDEYGNVVVSYLKAVERVDWKKADELLEQGQTCTCRVVGFNRGGLLVQFNALRGFMPRSQIGADRQISRSAGPDQLRRLVGETMKARVLEVDAERGRLVLSERAATDHLRKKRRQERLDQLEVGQIHSGRVVNLTKFGAFVDLGGVAGLVHLSELSHKHIETPGEHVQMGDDIDVKILAIDKDRGRITLSMKALEESPWQRIESLYQVGQLVEVQITQLTHYGAFVRFQDPYRLSGLIHISELAEERVEKPSDVVAQGQDVTARIIHIDADKQKIGLSIKQVFSDKFMHMDIENGYNP